MTEQVCDSFKQSVGVLVIENAFTLSEISQAARFTAVNAALNFTDGNQSRAARMLRVHRNTLNREVRQMIKAKALAAPLKTAYRAKKPNGRIALLKRTVSA